MSVVAGDILYKYSTTAGAAGNSGAGTAAGSFGKYISTTQITNATADNLFDDVTGDESSAGRTEYRCFFVHNSNADTMWQSVVAWLSAEPVVGTLAIAVDTHAASAIGASAAQALQIADEVDTADALAALTFTSPTDKASGIDVGDINFGQCRAIWVQRVIPAGSSAHAGDGVTIRCEGDTV